MNETSWEYMALSRFFPNENLSHFERLEENVDHNIRDVGRHSCTYFMRLWNAPLFRGFPGVESEALSIFCHL